MEQALLVVNLEARSVSHRVKKVIEKALAADLKLEVGNTTHRGHATELARDAADRGFDLVIAFGGDGTMNEVANGLVGTDTALTVLPGGMANVLCRSLGIPADIVEATGYLLNRVKAGRTRRINVGKMDGRFFVMSCGVGLDAATVRRVEAHPARKRRYRDWFFIYSALQTAVADYRRKDPYLHVKAGDIDDQAVLAIVSNIRELTYFKRWPVIAAPEATLEGGLDVLTMRRFRLRYIPRLVTSLFGTASHIKHRQVRYAHDVSKIQIRSSGPPFPVQVDGEFVGDRSQLEVKLIRDGLVILT